MNKILFKGKGNTKEVNIYPLEDKWILSRSIDLYLKEEFNLTKQEFYNLVNLGGKNNTPRCESCNKLRSFRNILEGYNKCTRECSARTRQLNLSRDKENNFQNKSSEHIRKISEYHRMRVQEGTHPLQHKTTNFKLKTRERQLELINSKSHNFTSISHSKSLCTQFKNSGNISDVCKFYIIKLPKGFKLGITIMDLSNRYTDYKVIYILESDRNTVADLELAIKLEFKMTSEYFTEEETLRSILTYLIKEVQRLERKLVHYKLMIVEAEST